MEYIICHELNKRESEGSLNNISHSLNDMTIITKAKFINIYEFYAKEFFGITCFDLYLNNSLILQEVEGKHKDFIKKETEAIYLFFNEKEIMKLQDF